MGNIRTTHTGSLPRPPELAELVRLRVAPSIAWAKLGSLVEGATRQSVESPATYCNKLQ